MKYCKDCKYSEKHRDYEGDISYWCKHPNIMEYEENQVSGKYLVRKSDVKSWLAWDVRRDNCRGDWWEKRWFWQKNPMKQDLGSGGCFG